MLQLLLLLVQVDVRVENGLVHLRDFIINCEIIMFMGRFLYVNYMFFQL